MINRRVECDRAFRRALAWGTRWAKKESRRVLGLAARDERGTLARRCFSDARSVERTGRERRHIDSIEHRTVALVGRPNVGKSTLFNRLVGGRSAIVSRVPGTTRDSRSGEANLAGLTFTAIDTGGLEEAEKGTMANAITDMTSSTVGRSGLVLFMIDAVEGLTHDDVHFARWLRRRVSPHTPIRLVANKTEGMMMMPDDGPWEDLSVEASRLGFGYPIPVSAEHGDGLIDMYHVLAETFGEEGTSERRDTKRKRRENVSSDTKVHAKKDLYRPKETLEFAILGQPNVGKSTLVNYLKGEDRVLTGPTPGLTRDVIAVTLDDGLVVHDTAGIRRASKREHGIPHETLAVTRSLRTMETTDVSVLLVDGQTGMIPKQDMSLLSSIVEEGRGVVVAVTKCDLIPSFDDAFEGVSQTLRNHISYAQVGEIPIVAISALTGEGVVDLIPTIRRAQVSRERHVPTHKLNKWLRRFTALQSLGHGVRIKYMTQVGIRPPTFSLFANRSDLPESIVRSITNALRDEFDIHGVALRLNVRHRGQDDGRRRRVKRKPVKKDAWIKGKRHAGGVKIGKGHRRHGERKTHRKLA